MNHIAAGERGRERNVRLLRPIIIHYCVGKAFSVGIPSLNQVHYWETVNLLMQVKCLGISNFNQVHCGDEAVNLLMEVRFSVGIPSFNQVHCCDETVNLLMEVRFSVGITNFNQVRYGDRHLQVGFFLQEFPISIRCIVMIVSLLMQVRVFLWELPILIRCIVVMKL